MTTVPQYQQFASDLRRDILSGRYGWEGGLPGIQELVKRSGLAANTIYRALSLLVGERLIEQRDKAYYVSRHPIQMTRYVLPIAVRMKALNKEGYIKNIGKVERTVLPEHLAGKINAQSHPQACVLQACILGELAGDGSERPNQMSHYYFLLPMSEEQIRQLEENAAFDPLPVGPAIQMSRHDEITARPPTQKEIETLNLPAAASVIAVLTVVRDESGIPLLIQEDAFPTLVTLMYDYTFENSPSQ